MPDQEHGRRRVAKALANRWIPVGESLITTPKPIDSPRIRTLRQEITGELEAVRQALGVQLAFDRNKVVRLIAELEGIAEQAQYHVAQWQRRPGANVDASMIRAAKKLIQDCHRLHEGCVASMTREQLARDCRKLAQDWSKLRPQLMACKTIDKHTLRRIADDANRSARAPANDARQLSSERECYAQ